MCRTERDPTAGKGEKEEGVFSIAPVEKREWEGRRERKKKREKRRGTETERGERGIYSGTGFLSAVSLTMLCKAKVVANFQIHYVYIYVYKSKKIRKQKEKKYM